MTAISVIGHFKIDAGKLDQFKSIVEEAIQTTQEKDQDTTEYEWSVNDTGDEVVVRECYTNSDALILHAENVAPYMAQMQSIAKVTIQVFGKPNDALAGMLSGIGIPIFKRFASI